MPEQIMSKTTEPLPFVWRISKREQGRLMVEVGDMFVPKSPFDASPEGVTQQVGVDAVMASLQLVGLTMEEAKGIMLLVLQMVDNDGDDE